MNTYQTLQQKMVGLAFILGPMLTILGSAAYRECCVNTFTVKKRQFFVRGLTAPQKSVSLSSEIPI